MLILMLQKKPFMLPLSILTVLFLLSLLCSNVYSLAVINLVKTIVIRKTFVHKTKSDKIDAFLLIKSLMVNSYQFYTKQDI